MKFYDREQEISFLRETRDAAEKVANDRVTQKARKARIRACTALGKGSFTRENKQNWFYLLLFSFIRIFASELDRLELDR